MRKEKDSAGLKGHQLVAKHFSNAGDGDFVSVSRRVISLETRGVEELKNGEWLQIGKMAGILHKGSVPIARPEPDGLSSVMGNWDSLHFRMATITGGGSHL